LILTGLPEISTRVRVKGVLKNLIKNNNNFLFLLFSLKTSKSSRALLLFFLFLNL